jgi:predicted GIY-YIG superfamily endonuclease
MTNRYKTYLILFENGYLYTGSTGNFSRRLRAHLKATKADQIYHESYGTRAEALAREKQIKGWPNRRNYEETGSEKGS